MPHIGRQLRLDHISCMALFRDDSLSEEKDLRAVLEEEHGWKGQLFLI